MCGEALGSGQGSIKFELPRFWRLFAKHHRGCIDLESSETVPGSKQAVTCYSRHPSTFLFRRLESQELLVSQALAQRICVSGIVRYYFAVRGRHAPPLRNCQRQELDGATNDEWLTQQLLERLFREACPTMTMDQLDEEYPPMLRYYVGVTSVMDYVLWKQAPPCGRRRHHRRCGLTRTPLECSAIIDSVIQQSCEELAGFLQHLIKAQGSIEILATNSQASELLRQGLSLAWDRLPKGSGERRRVEAIWREGDLQRLWSRVAGIWNEFALDWFLARELVHDLAPESVSLKPSQREVLAYP